MKKRAIFFAALCALCSALNAQQTYYEGQGGKNLGGINVSKIEGTGISDSETELLPLIQMTLHSDFQKYAGIAVADLVNPKLTMRYTLTGTITKTGGQYFLQLSIKDGVNQTVKAGYGPIQCTLDELRSLKAIKAASEELIAGMGVTLTAAGKTALQTTATKEAEAMNALAKSAAAGATEFEKVYYTYQASQLDPSLAEAARRRAAYQTENYQVPVIDLTMPVITIPAIKAPQFKAQEIKMVATGNIGADARKQQQQYEAQKEVSRLRQESGTKALKEMQDAFLAQFKAQQEAVKKQQAELLKQRDVLLGQQRILLEKKKQTIAQMRDTENAYDTFFREHPPIQIIYDPAVTQVGDANLVQETINLQFQITSTGTTAMELIPLILADFEQGYGTITRGLGYVNAEFYKIQTLLNQAEGAGSSALAQLARDYAAQMKNVQAAEDKYAAELAKLDRSLGTSGYAQLGRDYAVKPDTGYAERLAKEYAVRPSGYDADKDTTTGDTWSLTKWNKDETLTFAVEARLENDKGKTIGPVAVNLTNEILVAAFTQPQSDSGYCVFFDVPVNDITDRMKVSIRRVNNRDITRPENAGYIKVSPLEKDGFTKDGYDIDGYDKQGYDAFGWNRKGRNRKGHLSPMQQELDRFNKARKAGRPVSYSAEWAQQQTMAAENPVRHRTEWARQQTRAAGETVLDVLHTFKNLLPHQVSVGTTFTTPLLTLSAYNTLYFAKGWLFVDYGCDFGLIHGLPWDIGGVEYSSFYPNAHFGGNLGGRVIQRGTRRKTVTTVNGFFLGIGGGCMITNYVYPNHTVRIVTPAIDLKMGVSLGLFEFGYTMRFGLRSIEPIGLNHKLSLGLRIPY
jgi:hypothetical protein